MDEEGELAFLQDSVWRGGLLTCFSAFAKLQSVAGAKRGVGGPDEGRVGTLGRVKRQRQG